MKRSPTRLLALRLLPLFCLLALTGPVAAQDISKAAAKPVIKKEKSDKFNIAVITLKNTSGISAGEAELITDRLSSELFSTGVVNVMERNQMQEILKEQGFQQSGACTDEACMVEMGQLLGVEALISGSIGKLGSMYMMNLRMIDVKTGQIKHVVSDDIKGDVEDVVTRLRGIAQQLVSKTGAALPAPVAQPVEQKPSPKPAETAPTPAKVEEQKTPEPVVAQPVEQPAEEVASGGKASKNKNRSGIRLQFRLMPGGFDYNVDGKKIVVYDWVKRSTSAIYQLGVPFHIRTGRLFTINIGPMWTHFSDELSIADIDSTTTYTQTYNGIDVSLGFNFVKRWYPFKLNAGLFLDGGFWVLAHRKEITDSFGSTLSTDSDAYMNGNLAPGFKLGGEILAGKHVGFNLDFVLCINGNTYTYDEDDLMSEMFTATPADSLSYSPTWKLSFRLPVFSVGFGVNFYWGGD